MLREVPNITRRAVSSIQSQFSRIALMPTVARQFGQNMMLGINRGLMGATTPLKTWAGNAGRSIGQGIAYAMSAPLQAKIAGKNFAMAGRAGAATGQFLHALPGHVARGAHNFASGFMPGLGGQFGQMTMRTRMGQLGMATGHATRFAGMGLVAGAAGGVNAARAVGSGAMAIGRGAMNIGSSIIGNVSSAGGQIVSALGGAFSTVRNQAASMFSFIAFKSRRMAYDFRYAGLMISTFLTLPILGFAADSVKTFAKFDDAIHTAMATLGDATGATKKALVGKAFDISSKSRTSPEQIASGYYHLASAGFKAADAIELVGAVEKFAVAGALDLDGANTAMARSTDYLVDIMQALGMRTDDTAKNMTAMTHVSDVLTKANQIANGTVDDFAKSLTGKGAAAIRLLNKDMEEGVAVLAAYASQGVKGTAAGEKLYIISRDLQRAVLKNGSAWSKFGISIYDANGKMLPFAKIVGGLEKVLTPMSDKTKRATLMQLGFQDRSLAATMQLLGMSDAIKKYEAELRAAAGTTDMMANMRLKSFSGQMMVLGNQFQKFKIQIGELLVPVIMGATESIRQFFKWWEAISIPMRRFIVVGAIATAVGGSMVLLFGMMASSAVMLVGGLVNLGLVFATSVFGPIKLGIVVAYQFIKVIGIMVGSVVMAAARIAGTIVMTIGTLLVSALTTAFTTVMGLVGGLVQLTLLAGPIGLVAGVLGAISGFMFVAAAGFAAFTATMNMIGGAIAFAVAGISGFVGWLYSGIAAAAEFVIQMASPKGLVGGFNAATGAAQNFGKNAITTIRQLAVVAAGFMENYTANMKMFWDYLEKNWKNISASLTEDFNQIAYNLQYNMNLVTEMLQTIFQEVKTYIGAMSNNMWIDFVDGAKKALNQVLIAAIEWALDFARVIADPTGMVSGAAEFLSGSKRPSGRSVGGLAAGKKQIVPDIVGNVGSTISDTIGNLKSPLEGVKGPQGLPALPKFKFDVKKPAEEAIKPLDMVSAKLKEIKDDTAEPIKTVFSTEGVDALRVGTADAMQALLEYRREAMNQAGTEQTTQAVQKDFRGGNPDAVMARKDRRRVFMEGKAARREEFVAGSNLEQRIAKQKIGARDKRITEGLTAMQRTEGPPGQELDPSTGLMASIKDLKETMDALNKTEKGKPVFTFSPLDVGGGF